MGKSKKNNGEIAGATIPVNFKLDNVTFEKVKDLAHHKGFKQADIYNKSVVTYIKRYEEKYGAIPARPSGNGLDELDDV